MKNIYLYLFLFFFIGLSTDAFAQPANDECANATSLGTLPAPAACTGTGTKRGATVTLTNQTNVGATSSNPYPYTTACAINTASIPNDVWYSFVASSYQANIAVSAATGTLTNPVITFWSGACGNQASSGCITGSGNAATLVVYQLTIGQTYYIQIAGADATQNGTFTLAVHNDNNCSACLVSSHITATPPPINGTYAPGQTVNFCLTIDNWDETNTNWLHGIQPSFGAGWDLTTLTPGTPPASVDGRGTWSWQSAGVTSSANLNNWPAGFYYNSSLPNNYVGGPGNSYGDDCNSGGGQTCSWTFCVSITTNTACSPGSNLNVTFNTSGDGESGVWSSIACQNDRPARANAIGSCCPPTMSSTPASCANPNGGTATAAPTGTISPWTFHWSNGTTQTGLTGPSTITGLAAGIDTVTVTDALNCSTIGVVTVTNNSSVSAGPAQTISCLATLPGGTATMAAAGVGGSWTAQAGNPGTATITTPTSATTTITGFSAPGVYTFVWADSGCNATTTVTVTAKPNAGPDQTVTCVTLPGGSATMAAVGTGTWTAQTGNPGTATITTPGSATTTITTFSAAGIYYFIWTDGNGCTDTANVNIVPLPNAGPDQTITCVVLPGGTATMAAVGVGFWQAAGGNPGSATITNPVSATTTITGFSAAGTYHFVWSIGICTDTAAVTVSAAPSAGPDQFISCFPTNTSTTMAATGTGVWTAAVANPGSATITSAASPTTSITAFSALGVYTFYWTNGGCVDTALVTVTATANAGPDQTVSCITLPGGSATMAAGGVGQWTIASGNPGTASITNASNPLTTITAFTAAGTYHYIWTSSGCSDTAAVTVTTKPDAGPDQFVTCYPLNNTATLAATGTGTWTPMPSNSGTSTITSPNSPTTTITGFSVIGAYGFIWTSGNCTDTALVVVTANPNAGPDQIVTCALLPGGTATMAALGTGAWTADASNPGTATITATADPATTITAFSAAGTYNFIWTSGTCSDTASVSVTAKPDAGPDQTVSCIVAPGGTATMAATGAGTWTADPANAGTATITTSNDPATTITSFSTAGSYNFIWTNNDGCPDTAVVTVTAKPNAGSDATVCQNGTALLEATGTGVWSALPGNPSSATIDFPANSSVNVTGLTVAGTYGFVWPINGCADTANVLVNAPPVLAPTTTNITCNNATGAIFANAAGSGLTYLWSTGSTTDSINTTTAGVSYTVTVTDINQCTASASGTVNNNIVTVGITDVPTNVSCFGYNDGSIILTVTPAGTYTYSWDNTTGRDTVTGLAPGSYSVTATDANGCSSTLGPIVITEPTVDLVSITPLDTTIFLGDSIQLGSAVTGSYPVLTYAWTPTAGLSCTNCPNPLLVPTDFDTVKRQYQLTITYNNGCIATATDSILARPNDLSAVPNAFSPNGDDKNAVFKILATGVQSFRMNIYNRWGEQVFSSTDINQGWDGTYKGNQQPSEVYSFFYTITYHDGKVETKEGNVTLFR